MADFIKNTNSINLVICGIIILSAIYLITRTVKELTLKFGDKSISLSGNKTQSEMVKVVTDYADFKYKIKEEQHEGINDLHEQAKRVCSLKLDLYIRFLTADYITVVNSRENKGNATMTINLFSLLLRLLYNEMFKFLLEIFERNHLNNKSDSEIREMADTNYQMLATMFVDFMKLNWFDVMGDYNDLHSVCLSQEKNVKRIMLDILNSFRDLSREKYNLINTINDIDCRVRDNFQKFGRLPLNAISILSDLYIPGAGLNKNSVDLWLNNK